MVRWIFRGSSLAGRLLPAAAEAVHPQNRSFVTNAIHWRFSDGRRARPRDRCHSSWLPGVKGARIMRRDEAIENDIAERSVSHRVAKARRPEFLPHGRAHGAA